MFYSVCLSGLEDTNNAFCRETLAANITVFIYKEIPQVMHGCKNIFVNQLFSFIRRK